MFLYLPSEKKKKEQEKRKIVVVCLGHMCKVLGTHGLLFSAPSSQFWLNSVHNFVRWANTK